MIEPKVLNQTKGISFPRLMPFLSPEFKSLLVNNPDLIKDCFLLNSEEAYQLLEGILTVDVNKEKGKLKGNRKSLLDKLKNLL